MKKFAALLAVLLALLPASALALDEDGSAGFVTVLDEDGNTLARHGGLIALEDEWITSDNRRFVISGLNGTGLQGRARLVEQVTLPEVALPAAQSDWTPVVCVYCTHSDESYVPASGTESEADGGDILEVAETFAQQLNRLGCKAVLDESLHGPHDKNAYDRSRETAAELISQENPTLLVDIHRDGAPEDEYTFRVNDTEATHVRIVLGRKNENREDNEVFAQQLKAVADALYPGLVKDIFLGKGQYNQDLMSRSLLLEIGTHESDKEAALNSAGYAAQVVASALGASGTVKESSTTGTKTAAATPAGTASATPTPQSTGNSSAAGPIILIVIILASAAVCVFFLLRNQ